ncbi:MAG: TIGR04255 family protein [Armatimonadetes bacterium]|nr:TIGR04255 family protein [Armatimonadota bacterium]
MRKTYEKSPIVEAVCEFRFDPAIEWDLTIPGLVYEHLRDQFPTKRSRDGVPVEFGEVFAEEVLKELYKQARIMQFVSNDEHSLVQLGHHFLSVNQLRPYQSWEQFRSLIEVGLNAYQEVANPEKFVRIGLRYINRIDIPGKNVRTNEYLNAYPVVPEPSGKKSQSWLQRTELPYNDENAVFILHVGTINHPDHDGDSFMIDLDFATQHSPPPINKAFDWLNRAHNHLEDMFEAAITDKTRELIKEVGEVQQ